MKIKHCLSFLLITSTCILVSANITLPKVFSNNMVIQRNLEIPVWGWGDAGEKISITFKNQKANTSVAKNGEWMINLKPEPSGGPFTLTIKGKNELVLSNVLIGDVWICSGQSNMEWPLWNTIHGANEVKKAANKNIRLITVPKVVSLSPLKDFGGDGWVECNPENVHDFSAVGYYVGKFLQEDLDVPIGLINTNWGGTRVEPWTSAAACKTNDYLRDWYAKIKNVDIEELKKQEQAKAVKYDEAIAMALGKNGVPHPYTNPDFKDTNWKEITLPGLWEDAGIGVFDGIVWFRKSFIIPENFDLKNATLLIGKIDDSDISWINETIVGQTYMQYTKLREYKIPENLLHTGKNSIVVRVEDYVGAGGIYGKESEMKITDGKSEISLAGTWKYMKEDLELPRNPQDPTSNLIGPNDYPTLLFNAMINPLIPYGIKGAIWYQGEANADNKTDAVRYRELFPIMINDWRKNWSEGDFPFIFVQLANYMEPAEKPKDEPWAYLRESQTAATTSLPNVGMACIIDIGDGKDIHPRNKFDVGKRLELNALKIAYGKDVVYSGPVFKSVVYFKNKAIITFDNIGSGLIVRNKYGYINAFAVAGENKTFQYARAEITSNNTITVYSPDGKDIVAIRYAWANNPDDVDLYNQEGLPAVPFRTDTW